MTTQEIKANLINAINRTDNKRLLNEIGRLLKIQQKEEKLIRFNEKQNAEIDEAIKQIERGEYLTNEEAQKDVDKWLEG